MIALSHSMGGAPRADGASRSTTSASFVGRGCCNHQVRQPHGSPAAAAREAMTAGHQYRRATGPRARPVRSQAAPGRRTCCCRSHEARAVSPCANSGRTVLRWARRTPRAAAEPSQRSRFTSATGCLTARAAAGRPRVGGASLPASSVGTLAAVRGRTTPRSLIAA
jgi:hypothetical protein